VSAASAIEHDAVHVYGVVSADALEAAELPERVEVVRSGPLAALVSAAKSRGLAGEVRRHDAVVGAIVGQGVTIVPMRFGTIVTEPEALAAQVLDANRPGLLAALDDLAGLVQYTLRVEYVREAATRAALRDDPGIEALRARAERDRSMQIQLGQRIVAAIDRRRPADADRIRAALVRVSDRVQFELSQDPDRVGDFACLVERSDATQFEDAVEGLAERHHEAVHMTLVGPLAPYDFVPEL
jgi:hypothetical protein